MAKTKAAVPAEQIANAILVVRGHRVMLDADLAGLYGVETRALVVQALKRNAERFPEDFCFQLEAEELGASRSANCDLNPEARRPAHRPLRLHRAGRGNALLERSLGVLIERAAPEQVILAGFLQCDGVGGLDQARDRHLPFEPLELVLRGCAPSNLGPPAKILSRGLE